MSIIIRALKKADHIRKKEKKRGAIHRLPFLLAYGEKRKGSYFLFGLFTGLVFFSVVIGALFFIHTSAKKTQSGDSVLTKQQIEQFDMELLDLEVEAELGTPEGPDIEEEIEQDKLVDTQVDDATEDSELFQKRAFKIYDGDEDEPVSLSDATVNFPEFFVAGVVWDFDQTYVFINGIPYKENETCNGVKIQKISLSQLLVTYNDKNYEIVLQ